MHNDHPRSFLPGSWGQVGPGEKVTTAAYNAGCMVIISFFLAVFFYAVLLSTLLDTYLPRYPNPSRVHTHTHTPNDMNVPLPRRACIPALDQGLLIKVGGYVPRYQGRKDSERATQLVRLVFFSLLLVWYGLVQARRRPARVCRDGMGWTARRTDKTDTGRRKVASGGTSRRMSIFICCSPAAALPRLCVCVRAWACVCGRNIAA